MTNLHFGARVGLAPESCAEISCGTAANHSDATTAVSMIAGSSRPLSIERRGLFIEKILVIDGPRYHTRLATSRPSSRLTRMAKL